MKVKVKKGFAKEEKILTAFLLCLFGESVLLIFGANILSLNHRIAAIASPTIIFLLGYISYILLKASHNLSLICKIFTPIKN